MVRLKKQKGKAMPLTLESFGEAQRLRKELAKAENQILERIDYIVNTIAKTFGTKLEYWYFDGAEEGEVGSFEKHVYKDHLSIILEVDDSQGWEPVAILKDGHEWGFDSSIPLRWLFEDFEQELREGAGLWIDKQAVEKTKVKASQASIKALAKKAKAKLSKKELAALKAEM